MGLKGSDLISSLRTSRDKLRAQKSPQGLRRAGFQDFSGQFLYRRERILEGWRNLNKTRKLMYLGFFI